MLTDAEMVKSLHQKACTSAVAQATSPPSQGGGSITSGTEPCSAEQQLLGQILAGMEATNTRRRQKTKFKVRIDGMLRECCGPYARVVLFGSDVSGFATRDSDLDINIDPGWGKVRRPYRL